MNKIRNNFSGGMVQDSLASLQPNGTWSSMLNGVIRTESYYNFGVANERGNTLFAKIGGEICGGKYIEERNQFLIFSKSGGDDLITIVNEDGCIKNTINANDYGCSFGFKDCEWVSPQVKTIQPCNEIQVYWSAGSCYYTINVDELCDKDRSRILKQKIVGSKDSCSDCEEFDCDYFKLFNCDCNPRITPRLIEGGGNIPSGKYNFAIELDDGTGNTTNPTLSSEFVSVPSENNIPGELSNYGITLNFSCLSCNYSRINLYVTKVIEGVTTVEKLYNIGYTSSGFSYNYTGQLGELSSLEEVSIKRNTYIKGEDLYQEGNRLWLYGTKQSSNVNLQKYVNEADWSYVVYRARYEDHKEFMMPTMARGESYLPAVVLNYCDGTSSAAFIGVPKDDCGTESQRLFGGPAECPVTINTDDIEFVGAAKVRSGGETDPDTPIEEGSPSSTLENTIDDTISNIDTQFEDICTAMSCDDCNSDNEACDDDMGDIVSTTEGWIESWEYPPVYEDTGGSTGGLTTNGDLVEVEDTAPSSDDLDTRCNVTRTDCEGESKLPYQIVAEGKFGVKCTTNTYPDSRDCEGDFYFGKNACKPVKLFTVPCASQEPLTCSSQKGVVNKYQLDNDEFANTYVNLIGLKISNFKLPPASELPKPLCPNQPYRIVMVKRDTFNSSVIANGITTSTMVGNVRGTTYAYPRHGVNSFENIDAFVDDNNSLLTEDNDKAGYVFHSLDTRAIKTPLNADTIKVERNIFGWGFRHGLYVKGSEPTIESEGRVDKKGARQSVNLNHSVPIGEERVVEGITYAPADSVVTNPDGISYPLMNRCRESSVYMELDSKLPDLIYNGSGGGETDTSFVGDTLDHCCPINGASAWYTQLRRDIKDQYGSVEGMQFYDTGIVSHKNTEGGMCGLTGDMYIGPDTFVRTSCVSSKIGDNFCTPCGKKSICSSEEGYSTMLPCTGDVCNPKNWSGLHTVGGASSVVDGKCAILRIRHNDGPCYPASQIGNLPCEGLSESCPFEYSGTVIINGIPQDFSGTIPSQCVELDADGFYTVEKRIYCGVTVSFSPASQTVSIVKPNDDLPCCEDENFTIEWVLEDQKIDTCEGVGEVLGCANAAATGETQSEFYYPRVQNTLVMYWGEFRVNPCLRQTAVNTETFGVYYPKTKDIGLDSTIDAPECGLLNEFHCEIVQPSRAAIKRRNLIRSIIDLILPALGIGSLATIDGPISGTAWFATAPVLLGLWNYLREYLYSDTQLDELLGIPTCIPDRKGGEGNTCIKGFRDNYDVYDMSHSECPNINPYYSPSSTYNTCVCDEPTNEVYFSDRQLTGSQVDAYKNFKGNNYLSIPASAGAIQKLFSWGGNMYAHTTDSLWVVKYGNVTIPTSVGEQLLGGGDLQTQPQRILGDVDEGFAGLTDPNASIVTPFGYFFIDGEANKIYKFDGKLTEISRNGMSTFFKRNLDFCLNCDCRDEKSSRGVGYSIGYDPCLERIMVTKKDGEKSSFTLSYDPIGNRWISFHSYIPEYYTWDRHSLYSISKGGIWKHNEGDYQTFYGEYHPHWIEFSVVNEGLRNITHEGTVLATESREEDGTFLKDHGYNYISVKNNCQATGLLELKRPDRNDVYENLKLGSGKTETEQGKQRISGLWDNTDKCSELESCRPTECEIFIEDKKLNQCGVSKTSTNRTLSGDHLKYKLIHNDKDNVEILLKYVDVLNSSSGKEL